MKNYYRSFDDYLAENMFTPTDCRRCGAEPKKDLCYCLNCGNRQGCFPWREEDSYPERIDYSGPDSETLFCDCCRHMVTQREQTKDAFVLNGFFTGTCESCCSQMRKLKQEYIAQHSCHCHPESVAVKFCRCGQPICQECCDNYSGLYKDFLPEGVNDGMCSDCFNSEVKGRKDRQSKIDEYNSKSAIGKFLANRSGKNPWLN